MASVNNNDTVKLSVHTNRPIVNARAKLKPPVFWCEVCQLVLSSPTVALQHLRGRSHTTKAKKDSSHKRKNEEDGDEGVVKKSKEDAAPVKCEDCNLEFSSGKTAEEHFKGKRHATKIAQKQKAANAGQDGGKMHGVKKPLIGVGTGVGRGGGPGGKVIHDPSSPNFLPVGKHSASGNTGVRPLLNHTFNSKSGGGVGLLSNQFVNASSKVNNKSDQWTGKPHFNNKPPVPNQYRGNNNAGRTNNNNSNSNNNNNNNNYNHNNNNNNAGMKTSGYGFNKANTHQKFNNQQNNNNQRWRGKNNMQGGREQGKNYFPGNTMQHNNQPYSPGMNPPSTVPNPSRNDVNNMNIKPPDNTQHHASKHGTSSFNKPWNPPKGNQGGFPVNPPSTTISGYSHNSAGSVPYTAPNSNSVMQSSNSSAPWNLQYSSKNFLSQSNSNFGSSNTSTKSQQNAFSHGPPKDVQNNAIIPPKGSSSLTQMPKDNFNTTTNYNNNLGFSYSSLTNNPPSNYGATNNYPTLNYSATNNYPTLAYSTTNNFPPLNYSTTNSYPTSNYSTTNSYPTSNYSTANSYPTSNYSTANSYPTSSYSATNSFSTSNYSAGNSYSTSNYNTSSHYPISSYSTTNNYPTSSYSTTNNYPTSSYVATNTYQPSSYSNTSNFPSSSYSTTNNYLTSNYSTSSNYPTSSYSTTYNYPSSSYSSTTNNSSSGAYSAAANYSSSTYSSFTYSSSNELSGTYSSYGGYNSTAGNQMDTSARQNSYFG